ncbi:maltose O-acetyltransferase [Paraphaeosphaeria sporulosa]
MPSIVQATLINSGFFKDKTGEQQASAFTAVNGRNSPPSPTPRLNPFNGMTTTTQPRPVSRHSPEESKPRMSARDIWSPPRPAAGALQQNGVQNGNSNGLLNGHSNSHQNGDSSTSPTLSNHDSPPLSPTKRKRSPSAERDSQSPPDGAVGAHCRLDPHAPTGRGDPPNTIAQVQKLVMDHQHPRTLPPVDRIDTDTSWAPYSGYHDPQPQRYDLLRTTDSHLHQTSASQSQISVVDAQNGLERSSTTEITKAGVHVDRKKPKRQFANRTRTGCGTCRRRKKKCDESKPECNNCQRGGFICEGYANMVPWPKNGTPRPTAPLVAKDRYPPDPTQQLYHSHGGSRDGYTDSTSSNGPDGGRARPIVVEEQDHPSARSGWTNGWVDAPLPAYSQEQQHRPEYTPAPPQSSYRRSPLSTSAPPARQHTARNYHRTQESMAKHLNHEGTPVANATHPSQQVMIVSHAASAGPAPAPSHYAPPSPRHEKSEKTKMLNEEPFHPFGRELVAEREKCKNAIYRFNNTNNTHLTISPDEVERNFSAILLASWTQTFGGTAPTGHLGNPVVVETPFYCDYGYNIHIGSNVAIGMDCKFLDSGDITIGDNTTICANVTIDTVKTPTDPRFARGCGLQRTSTAAKVHIGRNVWIGTNCLLLAGVSIGDNATVHPGSVVVRDIPAERHARGPPADYF